MADSDNWKVVRKPTNRMDQGLVGAPNAVEARAPRTSATPKGFGTRPDLLNLQDYGRGSEKMKTDGSYKKGGKVKKTGPAKVHKGEYVINKSAAKKAGPKKLAALNRGRDVKLLKRTPFR